MRNELASWFGALWPGLDIRCTSNMSANAAILVREGYGVAVVITGSLPCLDSNELVLRPLSPALCSSSILAWKRGVPLSRAAESFIEYARCSLGMETHEI